MLQHNEKTNHIVVFSFSDGSVWCFGCGEYVITKNILHLQREFGKIKFEDVNENVQNKKKLEENEKDEEKKETEVKAKAQAKEDEEKKLDIKHEQKKCN